MRELKRRTRGIPGGLRELAGGYKAVQWVSQRVSGACEARSWKFQEVPGVLMDVRGISEGYKGVPEIFQDVSKRFRAFQRVSKSLREFQRRSREF